MCLHNLYLVGLGVMVSTVEMMRRLEVQVRQAQQVMGVMVLVVVLMEMAVEVAVRASLAGRVVLVVTETLAVELLGQVVHLRV
jgi:hypothetical protein